jgi:L-alanine-DL-glutamate epimerase-like enolase superfamily enzyme
MLQWSANPIKLELKYTWKLSRNATDYKINTIITVTDGQYTGKGEVAPNIRYDETPERVMQEFELFTAKQPTLIKNINDLTALLTELKPCNALRFGIESAYIHYWCAKHKQAVVDFLGVQMPPPLSTAFSLPIMETAAIADFFKHYQLSRFDKIKIKVNAEHAHHLLNAVSAVSNKPLIIDANEGWKDPEELIRFLETLKPFPIEMIEQPMPAAEEEAYAHVKKHSPFPLFADESVCAEANFEELKLRFDGINMKLMKAGGYLNGLSLLNEARRHGMKTMVGCMVETSLGISSAMQLCNNIDIVDLDGFLIIKDEPFNMVKEEAGKLSFA